MENYIKYLKYKKKYNGIKKSLGGSIEKNNILSVIKSIGFDGLLYVPLIECNPNVGSTIPC